MAVDPSRLKRPGRRGLGAPPTDGSPGIEDGAATGAPTGGGTAADDMLDATLMPADRSLHHDTEVFATPRPAPGQGRGEHAGSPGRRRLPPPAAEAKIPFTTRVSASTKERLEDACHYLRVTHQDFINQAIVAHLRKHGF